MDYEKLSLEINIELTHQTLIDFLRSQVKHAGFERGVVGISGGVDSSVSCYLTAEALGPENVLAVRMPYKTSSPESLEHAKMVIEATGVQHIDVPISRMVDPLFEFFPNADRIRRGNAMARARMIVLYDQSKATRALVIGTGNKTEILLGYTTRYGDSACDINPLGDLYKTQVRQLARALGVPEAIIQKPPSAGLWAGQTDEEELGFSYEDVDQFLGYFVDRGYSPEECLEVGFDPDFITAVMGWVRGNEFKRILPPIAKLSDRGEEDRLL